MPLDSRSVDQLLAVVALELDVLPVRPMEALLRRGDEALPRLLEHMRSGGWKRIENPQWFTILLGLLAPGRDEAAAAAVLFEVLERAVDMDAEEEEWLAVAAAEALARLGEAAIPTVRAGLSHEREAVRVYLCAVLGWIGSAEAVRILLELAESDLSVADAVAQALTDAVCVEAVPTLYRLLGRCPGHHRIEVEEAIRELGHDVPVKVPLDDDWRLRYRPDTWFESFDPGWAGIAAMTREIDAEHLAKRPAPPLRSLEEILADPPEEPVDRDRGPCVVCGDPGRTRLGLTTCSREHEGQMAWIQRRLLEEWANEGETDVFQVLGDAEWDLRTLRRWIMPAIYEAADSDPDDAPWLPGLEPSDDRGGTPEVSAEVLEDSETWEAELAIVHGTCRWFLERGEEELASALSRLLQAAEAGGTARRLSPAEAGRATSSVGRNDPCPCGSGRKHKKCCGRPGASPGGGGGSPVEPFGAPAPGGGTGPGGSSPFGGSEGATPFLSLVDPQGNPVVISRAHYHLVDASALRLALQADERFEATDDPGEPDDASAPGDPSEPDDPSADGTPIGSGTPPDGFVWGEPMSGPIASVAEGARRILGMVVLEGDRLTLECMSRERLAAGRKILEELAGSAIEHRADTAQDPWQATRDPARPRRRPGGEKDEIPLEVRRDLIQRLLDAQYRTWPDERLPALHGLTPREAADLVVGRRRLDALIGSFEAAERRRMAEDGFAYDFTWLRKELDLA